jgi:mannosyltransferase
MNAVGLGAGVSLRTPKERNNFLVAWGLLRRGFAAPRNDMTLFLITIILVAFTLRMYKASTTLMWGDEGFSVYSASRDLYAITFEGKDVDPHPPLYYYLFHFWLTLAGTSELSIRFFSIFFGTATVAFIYILGKRLFDARVGLISAALYAIAPFAVHYAQEVRMYALVMFLGTLTMYVFVRWLGEARSVTSAGQARSALAFFLSMLLTQYTLYQSAFLFVAQGIFLLPYLKSRFHFVLRWLAVSIAIVLLFIPWLLAHSSSAFVDVKDVAGDTKPMDLPTFLLRGFAAISVGPTIPLSTAFTLSELVLAITLVGIAIALVARAVTRNDWLLITHVVIPMLCLYPIYFLAPLYRGRLFALALVPLMLVLARSAVLITQRAKLAAIPIVLVVVGSSAYSLSNYFYNYSRYNPAVDDYIPAIRTIEKLAQPGDVILFHAYWQIGYFLSDYHGAPIEYRLLDNQNDVDYAMARPRNVWAIVQALPIHGGEGWLDEHAYSIDEVDYGQMRVLSYHSGNSAHAENFPSPIIFDNGIALLGYRLNDTPIESGTGVATIELDWRATQIIRDDYTISVRITDQTGEKIAAQADAQPINGLSPTSGWEPGKTVIDRRGLVIPGDTLPGEYAVQLVMYQYIDNHIASITVPESLRGPFISLGKISVVRAVAAPHK